METVDASRTCVPYERLDYMHVPTYAPLLCLLMRAEMLLIIFEIGKHLLPSIQSLMAVMVVVLYADMYVFKNMRQMKAFQSYVGGVVPVLLALLTNSNTLRLSNQSAEWLSVSWKHLCVDIAWIVICLFSVIISMNSTQRNIFCHMSLCLATLLGLSHVLMLDGQYSTPVAEFALRILLFYSCALMLYAVHGFKQHVCKDGKDGKDGNDTHVQSLVTLHASMPVLWVHILVLHVYVIICLLLVIHVAWCGRDNRLIKLTNASTSIADQKDPECAPQYDIFDSNLSRVDDLQNKNADDNTSLTTISNLHNIHNIHVEKSDENDILLQQLREAQAAQRNMHNNTHKHL